jgi:hypothetical protein
MTATKRVSRAWKAVCVAALAVLAATAGSVRASEEARKLPEGPPVVSNAPVLLVPPIEGGSGGWCLVIAESIGCGGLGIKGGAILAQDWVGFGFAGDRGTPRWTIHGNAVTNGEVAAVSVGVGARIPTRAERALPDHLRAVAVEWHGTGPFRKAPRLPRFVALNARGQAIPEPAGQPGEYLLTYPDPLRQWQRPTPEARGACRLIAAGLKQLSAQWGTVVTKIRGYVGSVGRPFLSCVSTEFYFENWPLLAGVLLDGAQPGRVPAPLPAMRALRGHPGVYVAPGSNGDVLARRIPTAWLVVERTGTDFHRALELLKHVRAVIHL